ncbi:MAG: hypothetical protein LUG54_09125, partial [Clostridiales bacterium]|nr:hypothetical protein [Clostridiales bacterium]
RHTTEIVSVGRPVKDLTVVVGNPKTKKSTPTCVSARFSSPETAWRTATGITRKTAGTSM